MKKLLLILVPGLGKLRLFIMKKLLWIAVLSLFLSSNAYALIKLTCYMNNPDGALLSPHSLSLMTDTNMFHQHSFNVRGKLQVYDSAYRGEVAHDGYVTKWTLDRNNGRIIYEISSQSTGKKINEIGQCVNSSNEGVKF